MARLGWLGLALVVLGCGDDGESAAVTADHPSRLRIRVVVADAAAASLSVYDVADREIVGRVALGQPATGLVASYTGETAMVLGATAGPDSSRLLAGGVSVIPHKDHIHIFKSAAQLLGPALPSGPAVFGDRRWTIASAAGVTSFGEDAWLQSRFDATPSPGANVAVAHAGAMAEAPCAAATVAASDGDHAVFVCDSTELAVVSESLPRQRIAQPAGAAVERLIALHRQPLMLGLGPVGKLVRVDAETLAATTLDVEPDLCDATLEIGPGPYATVLTSSGSVVRYDLRAGARLVSTPVLAPFDCASSTRPHLAATPGRAWVTSPTPGELVEVDTVAGRPVRRIALGGMPTELIVLGLDARNADLGTANDDLSE